MTGSDLNFFNTPEDYLQHIELDTYDQWFNDKLENFNSIPQPQDKVYIGLANQGKSITNKSLREKIDDILY